MKSGGSRRVQNVDRLTELYRAYLKLVWRTLRVAGVRVADLDDVTHDVFLVVHRKLLTSNPVPFTPDMRPEDYKRAWSAWLSRTAFYQANNYHRRAKRHRQDLMDNVDEIVGPRDEAAQYEERDYLLQLLNNTTPERRTMFLLVEMEDYTVAEAASILELTVTTATKRLRQARQDIEAAAVTLKRRDEMSRTPRKSGAFLLPFGVGAWVKLRVLLDPPAETAEHVWQRLQDSIARLDEEPEGSSSSPPSEATHPAAGFAHSCAWWAFEVGAQSPALGRHRRGDCHVASLAASSSQDRRFADPRSSPGRDELSQAPTSTVLDVADLPFVTSLVPATPTAHATLDPEEVRMINQAHVAYTGGDLAGTIAALNAYDAQFPEGQFKTDAQALRRRAQPRR